jgi:hypothetical protein
MSYSRWSNSKWYTYWHTQDPATANYNTALFDVCGVQTFTARQLREELDACIAEVQNIEPSTKEELDELKRYMVEFIKDIDIEYGKENMKIVKGDLIQMVKAGKFDIFAHGCNCRHVMGAGIAKQIAAAFPELEQVDQDTESRPGMESHEYLDMFEQSNVLGMNWYTQYFPGANFNLAYLECVVTYMRHDIWDTGALCMLDTDRRVEIGVPLIGCGIGAGDPKQVMGVLASLEAEERYNVTLVLYTPPVVAKPGLATLKRGNPRKTKKVLAHG